MERRVVLGLLLLVGACREDVQGAEPDTDTNFGDIGADSTSSSSDPVPEQRLDVGPGPSPDPVFAEPPPPPISGGTMILSRDGSTLFVADPDRDALHVVDVEAMAELYQVELDPGSEPGRLVEDHSGRVHVALRRSGEVATLDPETGEWLDIRPACANPRGLAVDPADDSILVACAEGILARLHPNQTLERLDVGHELRDIVDAGPPVRVSTFRRPRVLTLDPLGGIVFEQTPGEVGVRNGQFVDVPTSADPSDPDDELDDVLVPNTAWRTFATDGGGWAMLHQAAPTTELQQMARGYGGNGTCIPLQTTIVSQALEGQEHPQAWPFEAIAPAFDFALTPDRQMAAVVGGHAGSWGIVFEREGIRPRTVVDPTCQHPNGVDLPGEPTSVVFDREGRAWVQLREPGALLVVDPELEEVVEEIELAETSVLDSGHELFHRPTQGMIACVSCHPEGREDGRVWTFFELGPRRTQSLDIGLDGTEPFHWRGELRDIAEVVDLTFVSRMGGFVWSQGHVDALERWLFSLRPLETAAREDDLTLGQGRALFETLGCATCHSGPTLTDNATVTLGLHGPLQVPSLVGVAFRAPYMHDGRAPDLQAAIVDMLPFSEPGGTLDPEEMASLVAYLASIGQP